MILRRPIDRPILSSIFAAQGPNMPTIDKPRPEITAEDIKDTQAAIGWTNAKLAGRMYVTESAVEKWRSGKVKMGPAEVLLFKAVTKNDLRAARG